jgi:uncharacterized protein (DUF1697 family)
LTTYVALLRGINVGRAKRVSMQDLREVVEDLGYSDVRTLLNSGNVVFTSSRRLAATSGARLEQALLARTGVSSRVTLLSGRELTTLVEECPLLSFANDPTRLMVAVPSSSAHLARLRDLERHDWAPEALALGGRVAYLWCPEGLIASRVGDAVGRTLGEAVTTRNWATVTKLLANVKG